MNAPVKNDAWKLDPTKEAQAAKSLRESLIASYGEDDELVLDTIEGETGLFEIIDRLIVRRSESLGLAEGLTSVIDDFKGRQDRFKKRAETDKTLIEQALSLVELKKVERPFATLSMSARAPKLEVLEESAIPSDYWKAGDPQLDKKAVLDALKARAAALDALPDDPVAREEALAALPPEVPGACLSNAAPSLTIRIK